MNAEVWTILAVGTSLGGLIIALTGLTWRMIRALRADIDRRFDQVAECFREVRKQLARLADDHNALARELSELRGEIRGRLDERARSTTAG